MYLELICSLFHWACSPTASPTSRFPSSQVAIISGDDLELFVLANDKGGTVMVVSSETYAKRMVIERFKKYKLDKLNFSTNVGNS